MKTEFRTEQLGDPAMAASEAVIRSCVHCGFCLATCPTYVLLGDERDSPRGRIYLMKDMLENERVPSADTVKHVDRCLSCLSCMTTCPSGVNYMHLVDHARVYIEQCYRRPWYERMLRGALAAVLPHPVRFRLALRLARFARPLRTWFALVPALRPVAAMLALVPTRLPAQATARNSRRSEPRGTVALLQGCAEPVLRPSIREATVRLLERLGYEVVFVRGEGCCGALVHHLGRAGAALAAARANIDAWSRHPDFAQFDAIIVTAAGCGTTIKDYRFLLRNDPDYAELAAAASGKAMDLSEFLEGCGTPDGDGRGLSVAYHAACSLQHGQRITEAPRRLLEKAGYTVRVPAEQHLCCGSAGTYNILQPEIAGQLASRKTAAIARLGADLVVTSNIGCLTQLGKHSDLPMAHIVELIDWATGGPVPPGLTHLQSEGDL